MPCRGKAVRLVANKLLPEIVLAPEIERFATEVNSSVMDAEFERGLIKIRPRPQGQTVNYQTQASQLSCLHCSNAFNQSRSMALCSWRNRSALEG